MRSPILGSYCFDKTLTRNNLGEKGFIGSHVPSRSLHKDARQERWGILLTDLPHRPAQPAFLQNPRPSTGRWHRPQWTLLRHQPGKCLTDLPTGSLMKAFSQARSFFTDDASLCQGNKPQSQLICHPSSKWWKFKLLFLKSW